MRKGYDTVHLFLFTEFLPLNYDLSEYLEDVKTYYDKSGEFQYSSVQLKNIIIRLNKNGLSIRNSLCNFYSENFQGSFLNIELYQTIVKLNELLDINLFEAKVTRFDFFFDIETKHNPNFYLKFYGEKKRYECSHYPNGKYYKIAQKTLVFYNKSKEVNMKKVNIMRFEIRYLKNIKKQLQYDELRLKHLCEQTFIKHIESNALHEYLSIEKYYHSIFNLNEKLTSKKIDMVIYNKGVMSIGVNKVLDDLNKSYLKGNLTATQIHRYRKKMRTINDSLKEVNKVNHLDEIDSKLSELINQN